MQEQQQQKQNGIQDAFSLTKETMSEIGQVDNLTIPQQIPDLSIWISSLKIQKKYGNTVACIYS